MSCPTVPHSLRGCKPSPTLSYSETYYSLSLQVGEGVGYTGGNPLG